jgi:hypothetical protein
VEQVETGHQDGRAIEGLLDTGVLAMSAAGVGGVEKRVVTNHVTAHIIGPFEDLGTDVHKEKASKDHRPKIMILWTEWSLRNNAMARPDRREWVPMSV